VKFEDDVIESPDKLNSAWKSKLWDPKRMREVPGWRVETKDRKVGKEIEKLKGTILLTWGINTFVQVYWVPNRVIKAALRIANISLPSSSKRKKALAETT
jgi:hypothetical protein